jgi:hypothetical protein
MDEVLRFLEEFIEKDHRAHQAIFTEPDDNAYARIEAETYPFLEGTLRTELGRPLNQPPDKFEARRKYVSEVVARALYQVKRHEHPTLGEIYRAYLGATVNYAAGHYRYSAFVRRTPGGWKIFSLYFACDTCGATGRDEGARCLDCRGLGWTWATGHRFDSGFGKLVEVHKREEPCERYRAEYDAE